MPTLVSSANTTSADQVLLSHRNKVAGDRISDETMEELARRLVAEVDNSARRSDDSSSSGKSVSQTSALAVGAQELTFTWSEPFTDTSYVVSLYPTADPGAAIRVWVKSKSTTRIVFGIVGHTNAVSYTFTANAPS
jgi:hypothetical protein